MRCQHFMLGQFDTKRQVWCLPTLPSHTSIFGRVQWLLDYLVHILPGWGKRRSSISGPHNELEHKRVFAIKPKWQKPGMSEKFILHLQVNGIGGWRECSPDPCNVVNTILLWHWTNSFTPQGTAVIVLPSLSWMFSAWLGWMFPLFEHDVSLGVRLCLVPFFL